MLKLQKLAAPVGLAIALILIGLAVATAAQGESLPTYGIRIGYALCGALSVLIILAAWPVDVFDIDDALGYPDAGDTHQFVDDAAVSKAPIDLGYLGETESAADGPIHYVAAPETPSPAPAPVQRAPRAPVDSRRRFAWPFMAVPPQRENEADDAYRRRCAETLALSFPSN